MIYLNVMSKGLKEAQNTSTSLLSGAKCETGKEAPKVSNCVIRTAVRNHCRLDRPILNEASGQPTG